MTSTLHLLEAELLKIRRRRLTWFLLSCLMAALVLHAANLNGDRKGYALAVATGVGRYGQPLSPQAAQTGEAATAARMTLPGFLKELAAITDIWGIFALLILAAVQAGEEYDAGTVRTILMRGIHRLPWLLAKLAALWLACAVAWVVLAAECVAIGLWNHQQGVGGLGPSSLHQIDWLAFAGQLSRSWVSVVPYLSMGILFSVVGQGIGPSLIIGLIGRFLEMGSGVLGTFLIGARMSGVDTFGPWYWLWAPINVISLGWNADVWRSWGDPFRWKEILGSMGVAGVLPHLPSPLHNDPWLGAAILLGWTVLALLLSAGTLRRRDVRP